TSHYSHIPLSSLSKQPATTEIYTLSLHDALPIYEAERGEECGDEDRLVERVHDRAAAADPREEDADDRGEDRDAAERERIERQPPEERKAEPQQHDGNGGDRVGLEQVGRHPAAVADVVAH